MLLSLLLVTEDKVTHIGSGFITNKKGLFLTAAHVIMYHLHEIYRIRVGFPEFENPCKLYKIKVHYSEYVNPKSPRIGSNKKSYHQDLAICRIISYNYNRFYKIKTKRPASDEILTIKGYYNPEKISVPIINDTADLTFLEKEDTQFRIKHRLLSIFSNISNDYERNPELVSNEKKFKNCLTLQNSAHPGVSGAPVINSEDKVVGIFLGGNQSIHYCNVLCSKYIRKNYRFIT